MLLCTVNPPLEEALRRARFFSSRGFHSNSSAGAWARRGFVRAARCTSMAAQRCDLMKTDAAVAAAPAPCRRSRSNATAEVTQLAWQKPVNPLMVKYSLIYKDPVLRSCRGNGAEVPALAARYSRAQSSASPSHGEYPFTSKPAGCRGCMSGHERY